MTRLGSCGSRWDVRLIIGFCLRCEVRLRAGFGSVGVLEALAGELQHLDERQQKRNGALRALVQIRRVLAEAVAAPRRGRVIDGGAQAVGAEKPRERLTHAPE